jgi:hypothetical protein
VPAVFEVNVTVAVPSAPVLSWICPGPETVCEPALAVTPAGTETYTAWPGTGLWLASSTVAVPVKDWVPSALTVVPEVGAIVQLEAPASGGGNVVVTGVAFALALWPPAVLPLTLAAFVTFPAVTSAAVTVYFAVAVAVWPGSKTPALDASGHVYEIVSEAPESNGSSIATALSVVLPLLVIVKE